MISIYKKDDILKKERVSILKKSIKDFKLSNKRVIIRSDLNVPIKEGQIIDDTRIKKKHRNKRICFKK